MAITTMCRKDDEGAVHSAHWSEVAKTDIYLRTRYVGKVVATGERNGYDDSDFYATVWSDDQQKFIDVEYATTRGWSYPNTASVDADEALMEKWREEQQRRYAAMQQARKLRMERQEYGATLEEWKARLNLPADEWERLTTSGRSTLRVSLKLLGTKCFRSGFRKSCCEQLKKWLRGESKYPTPFSKRQLQYL